jgi:hypothetical protein
MADEMPRVLIEDWLPNQSLGCERWTAGPRLSHAVDRPWVRLA